MRGKPIGCSLRFVVLRGRPFEVVVPDVPPSAPQRTVKLQAMLDSCQIELDACRADRNRFAELNETLIAEKQSKHSQLMRAHADIDSLTQQCADARIECDKLRHQMDLAQSTLPAKELQVRPSFFVWYLPSC